MKKKGVLLLSGLLFMQAFGLLGMDVAASETTVMETQIESVRNVDEIENGLSEEQTAFTASATIPLEVNTLVSGTIEKSLDVKTYQITLEQDGYVNFLFIVPYIENPNKTKLWGLELYDADMNRIDIIARNGMEMDELTYNTGLAAGDYYVKIVPSTKVQIYNSFVPKPIDYQFKVNYHASVVWEREINNEFSQVNDIPTNNIIYGTLNPQADNPDSASSTIKHDVDYYRFRIDQPGYIRLDFSHSYYSELEYRLSEAWIYDADMEKVMKMEYLTNVLSDESPMVGVKPGYYYLKLSDSKYKFTEYEFLLHYTSVDDWEQEFNESYDTANPLVIEQAINGSIRMINDVDYYKFHTGHPGYYAVEFNLPEVNTNISYFRVNLYNSKMEMLDSIYSEEEGNKMSGLEKLVEGDYYLKVESDSDEEYCPDPYTLLVAPTTAFIDVPRIPGQWKFEAVKYISEKNIMGGVGGSDQFQPDSSLTRAMFATVLYRMAGSPAVVYSDKFTDVEDGKWYTQAILWANEEGIVAGYSDGSYGINDNITREQIAKMLNLYGKVQDYDISGKTALDDFTDKDIVSGWATGYMEWAVDAKMISGKPNGDGTYRLDPKGEATRAECAKMIMKFLEKYE